MKFKCASCGSVFDEQQAKPDSFMPALETCPYCGGFLMIEVKTCPDCGQDVTSLVNGLCAKCNEQHKAHVEGFLTVKVKELMRLYDLTESDARDLVMDAVRAWE